MAITAQPRNILDAVIYEPVQLAISQPHQALISALSVYLVASEAAMLAHAPFNWLMAIGAEWAYLRGLSSGETTATPWNKRLIAAAVALLILYGSLWGLRQFGALPKEHVMAEGAWAVSGAVALTLVHILSIGAVTFCSAMCHRDMLEAERVSREKVEDEQRQADARKQDREEERQALIQAEQDKLALEMERKRQELAIWEEGQAAKMRAQNARASMRRNARPARANAEAGKCPKCNAELTQAQWLAACRWGHCANCKEQTV